MTPDGESILEINVLAANAGIELLASELERQDIAVERVDWRPPAAGSEEALARLALHSGAIATANDTAAQRLTEARPLLSGVALARDVLPEVSERTLLHAGPPIDWPDMAGPLRGAIIGAAIYEGLADDADEAERLAAAGPVMNAVPSARWQG